MLPPHPSNRAILSELLRLAWPLMLSNLFFSVQIAIDRIFLSRYDPDASGAALTGSMLLWIPVIFVQNTGGFVVTFVAQYFGAKRYQEIGPIVHQALYWSLLGGVAVLLLFSPFAYALMAQTGHAPKLVQLEAEYFFCLCYAAGPVAVTASVSGFFAGRGDTRTVILINAMGCVVNALFDWLLIFGHAGFPEWGIVGAGWATALGCASSAALAVFLFLQPRFDEQFHTRRGFGFDGRRFRQLLFFGMPNGFQSTFDLIAWTLFTLMVGWFGPTELAATSNIFVVNALFFIPMIGIGQAGGVFVGQRLGEERPQVAERGIWIGLAFTLVFMTSMGVTVALVPDIVLWAFASTRDVQTWSQVAALMPGLLWYVALYSAFDGANVLLAFSLRGAGDTNFISWLYLIFGIVFLGIPVYLSYHLGWGFYWAWNFAVFYLVALSIAIFARFRWGPWRTMRVIEPKVL
jgi:MATE family multidrug resistance protein